MSIPVTMRAVIRHNAAKMKANNPDAMETDGLKSGNDNASNANIKDEEGENNNMDFTVSAKSDLNNGFHTNRDRGGGGGGSEEPMDFDLMGLPPISTAAPVVAAPPVRGDGANKANASPFKVRLALAKVSVTQSISDPRIFERLNYVEGLSPDWDEIPKACPLTKYFPF